MPAPMISTRIERSELIASLLHSGARASLSAKASSSSRSGRYSSLTCSPMRKSIIRRTSVIEGGGATTDPASRHETSVCSASSPRLRLRLRREPALRVGQQDGLREQVLPQQRQVARDLRQRRQQRRQVRLLQRLADGLFVPGKRLDLAANRHSPSA